MADNGHYDDVSGRLPKGQHEKVDHKETQISAGQCFRWSERLRFGPSVSMCNYPFLYLCVTVGPASEAQDGVFRSEEEDTTVGRNVLCSISLVRVESSA